MVKVFSPSPAMGANVFDQKNFSKMNLTKDEIALLEISAKELIKESIEANIDTLYFQQKAFDYLLPNGAIVQIQVKVVLKEDEFMEDFETQIMMQYR